MKITSRSFFKGSFYRMNLNELYLENKKRIRDSKDPKQIQDVLNVLGKKWRNRTSYGGYGENRKDVWYNTYLDKTGGYIHLGIDINVNAGTLIKCPFDAEIVDVFVDEETEIGWGGRLILKANDTAPFLVLGHIDPKTLPKEKYLEKGGRLGKVGTWPTNGNVFEHLHVQCITHTNFRDFDGYGFESDLPNNPNPFLVEF